MAYAGTAEWTGSVMIKRPSAVFGRPTPEKQPASADLHALPIRFSDLFMHPPAAAEWLPRVERRINNSVSVVGPEHDSEYHCDRIAQPVARTANLFFRIASNLLPSEPYIYASRVGDLIAEFRKDGRALTFIISEDGVSSFVVGSDGVPEALSTKLSGVSLHAIRRDVGKVMCRFAA